MPSTGPPRWRPPPTGVLVALVHRGGQITVPSGATVLQAGDRITLLGEPDGILQLTETYRG